MKMKLNRKKWKKNAMRQNDQTKQMAGNNDDDDDGGGGGGNEENAGAVQDFVRQLLDRDAADDEDDDEDDGGGDDEDDGGGGAGADAADDDPDEDDDDDAAEGRRGAVDGGIAGEVRDEQQLRVTRSLKCPLVLYFECHEDLDGPWPQDNPVLKRGTTVYVGLDKNTKLSLVFAQYCRFVNSKMPGARRDGATRGDDIANAAKPSDFEFLHCALLDPNQTVEASAMMKNDRVRVCRERGRERGARAETSRQQRESDRKYFKDLRQLLPNPSPEGVGACDAVLDCRGKVVDERGFSQNVLATAVRANSALISQRCKWLGNKISVAREDVRRRAEMTVPSDEEKSDSNEVEQGDAMEGQKSAASPSEDEDGIIIAKPVELARGDDDNIAGGDLPGSAAKVEDDEDDDPFVFVMKTANKGLRGLVRKSGAESNHNMFPNSVWVPLDHSPQAVKLLLEYCYTNRVQSLGHEAFARASKSLDSRDVGAAAAKQSGPVPPFRKLEWPEGGAPAVSLHLALAGIALAEEARAPRLSLMCEIAASQLVDNKNVADVLSACRVQQSRTGNRLPLLRKAAVLDCIMANGGGGIDQLYANPNFKVNLDERRGLVIPSLLDGTVEVMPTNMNTKDIKRKKERMSLERKKMFEL